MKKKLLAIMLCAVLLTGVCATSFASRDIGSVLSKHSREEEKENRRNFREVKRLLREAYENFSKLSEPTLNAIKNSHKCKYDSIPILLSTLEECSDGYDVKYWNKLFIHIYDEIKLTEAAVELYIRERHPHTLSNDPDFKIASESIEKTELAKQKVLAMRE